MMGRSSGFWFRKVYLTICILAYATKYRKGSNVATQTWPLDDFVIIQSTLWTTAHILALRLFPGVRPNWRPSALWFGELYLNIQILTRREDTHVANDWLPTIMATTQTMIWTTCISILKLGLGNGRIWDLIDIFESFDTWLTCIIFQIKALLQLNTWKTASKAVYLNTWKVRRQLRSMNAQGCQYFGSQCNIPNLPQVKLLIHTEPTIGERIPKSWENEANSTDYRLAWMKLATGKPPGGFPMYISPRTIEKKLNTLREAAAIQVKAPKIKRSKARREWMKVGSTIRTCILLMMTMIPVTNAMPKCQNTLLKSPAQRGNRANWTDTISPQKTKKTASRKFTHLDSAEDPSVHPFGEYVGDITLEAEEKEVDPDLEFSDEYYVETANIPRDTGWFNELTHHWIGNDDPLQNLTVAGRNLGEVRSR